MPRKVLILGGTLDARRIAMTLHEAHHDVTTSLAGVTSNPELPAGKLRVGGFGGAQGLRDYIVAEQFDAVIDATHPFAVNISRNLADALSGLSVDHLSFVREAWRIQDEWLMASSSQEAAALMPSGARVFLAIGRKEIGPFVQKNTLSGIIRSIENPGIETGSRWVLLSGKPSASVDDEAKLLREFGITHLVCKNSGGDAAFAKLEACKQLSVQVVMINTPTKARGKLCYSLQDIFAEIEK